ncbi:TetR/AcrR family transcriptional regulator [Mycobacterium sp.]|uniref:TetR/AcrR family transcriptional regulator n=1 Tax=Mycobacterium sp. TaxID=1785 RepID=UPI003BA8781B
MNRDRVERRTAELRSRVLAVAGTLFDEQGIETTTLDQIAEEADVARRTLFNHFPSKAHIIRELTRIGITAMITNIEQASAAANTTEGRIRALFGFMRHYAADHGPMHRELIGQFIQVAHDTPDDATTETRITDAMLALLQADNTTLPTGARPETTAEILLGTIYFITFEWINRPDYDIDAHLAQAAEQLIRLVAVADPDTDAAPLGHER